MFSIQLSKCAITPFILRSGSKHTLFSVHHHHTSAVIQTRAQVFCRIRVSYAAAPYLTDDCQLFFHICFTRVMWVRWKTQTSWLCLISNFLQKVQWHFLVNGQYFKPASPSLIRNDSFLSQTKLQHLPFQVQTLHV